jgi:glutamine cyclotransferase
VLPYDLLAFTWGLQWHKNHLVELMGMYGDLLARIWNPEDGTIEQETKMEDKYFGEGLCCDPDENGNDHRISITWKEQTAFIVADETLKFLSSFEYMTHNNQG